MTISRLFQRAYHLGERIMRESRRLPQRWKAYGAKVALISFADGLIPPGKSRRYIDTVGAWVDCFLQPMVNEFKESINSSVETTQRTPDEIRTIIWCCWWQGEEQMPELVQLCHARLNQIIPADKVELRLVTLENYKELVRIPEHIIEKFESGIISMATMSDILRFALLEKYGGYWLDATLFFTDDIPEQYFSRDFFCQRMAGRADLAAREACRCNWCGFSMAGAKGNPVFRYMNRAFDFWYRTQNDIIDYVLIDYILWTGYTYIPEIRQIIDAVPDNNEDIFEMYKVLNQPYSTELYEKLTRRNVMHKLTYKMDLQKQTPDGQLTLYGWLIQQVLKEK